MKKGATIGLLAAICTACTGPTARQQQNDIIAKTYFHKYGTEMSSEDWFQRGKDGCVVTTLSDGVTVTRNYSHGVLHGEATYTFPHVRIISRTENYEQGNLVKEVFHNKAGAPEKEIVYVGPQQKIVTEWYESGSPRSVEEFTGEKLVQGQYYNLDQQQETKILAGEGNRMVRDSYGTLQCIEKFEEGELVLRSTFHPNGSPKERIPFVDGRIEGEKRIYLPSGEPYAVEEWAEGKRNGTTRLFQNGEKVAEIPYVNDMKEGVERRFREGTDVVQEISWSRNQRHGPTRTYIGNVTQTEWYLRGREVTRNTFDQTEITCR